MKVALLTDSNVFAGTERHMLDLSLELLAFGVQPVLVCPVAGALAQKGRLAGLPVRGLEKRGAIDPFGILRLRQMVDRDEFQLIHAHNGRTALMAALARRFAGRGALVATQHFLQPARATRAGIRGIAGRRIHRLAEGNIDYHIAISGAVGKAMLARSETLPGKLRVVLNGICDPSLQTLSSPLEVRTRYGVPKDALLVVCLARLEPEKGVETLIEAMRFVRKALPRAQCLIAGCGSRERTLKDHLACLQPASPVRLLGFAEDPLSLLNAADLFVLPSFAEPFGLSIVEAMALAKPVVTTRAGGPLEIVIEGETGLLTPPGEPEPLAAAIISILSQPSAAAAMGGAARNVFLARFTAARMARQILDVYEEALRSPCVPRSTNI